MAVKRKTITQKPRATKKTAKAKATSAKKKPLKEMSQTHGALDAKQDTEDLIRGRIFSYKQEDLGKYTDYLYSLDLADLHDHAIEKGQVPIGNKTLLIDRLEKEFAKAKSKLKQEFNQVNAFQMSKENKEEALRIMRRRLS